MSDVSFVARAGLRFADAGRHCRYGSGHSTVEQGRVATFALMQAAITVPKQLGPLAGGKVPGKPVRSLTTAPIAAYVLAVTSSWRLGLRFVSTKVTTRAASSARSPLGQRCGAG